MHFFNPHFRGHSNGKFSSVHSPHQGAGQTMGQACNHAFNDRNQFYSAGKLRDLGQFRRFNYRKHVVAITVNWRTAKNLSNGEKNISNNRFFRCFRSFRVYEALASIVILSNVYVIPDPHD